MRNLTEIFEHQRRLVEHALHNGLMLAPVGIPIFSFPHSGRLQVCSSPDCLDARLSFVCEIHSFTADLTDLSIEACSDTIAEHGLLGT